jgi:plastocyanin domain-containing protein
MMLINVAGFGLILLIIWWFWLFKAKSTKTQDGMIEVIVKDGVYHPSNITLPANKPIQIVFIREDPAPCAETLVIPDLEISETLPLNKKMIVEIPASKAGKYPFHCQMQMYRGNLIVE